MRAKVNGIKSGDKVKIIANTAGHGFPIGSIVTLVKPNLNQYGDCTARNEQGNLYTIHSTDFEIVMYSKEDLQKKIKDLKEEISLTESKLKYMEEVGSDKFDLDEFEVYHVLKVVEAKGTKINKAREIVKILRRS